LANGLKKTSQKIFLFSIKSLSTAQNVAYAVRWIYARVAYLPAAATTKDGRLVGHWSTGVGRLPTHPNGTRITLPQGPFYPCCGDDDKDTPSDTYHVRMDRILSLLEPPFFVTTSLFEGLWAGCLERKPPIPPKLGATVRPRCKN